MRYHSIRIVQNQTPDNKKYCAHMKQKELSSSLVRMQNGVAILQDSLTVSYKIKHIFTICFSNQPHYLVLTKGAAQKPAPGCLKQP